MKKLIVLFAAVLFANLILGQAPKKYKCDNPKLFDVICYSPFRDGQSPVTNEYPIESQIKEDINVLKKYTNEIRIYGINGSLSNVLKICEKEKMGVHIGIWLSNNLDDNEDTITSLQLLLSKNYSCIQSVIVGNETKYRNDLSVAQLVEYINRVKGFSIYPVTTGEPFYIYLNYPSIANSVDYILYHCHPYWESHELSNSPNVVLKEYYNLIKKYPEKEAICGETGWPTNGKTRRHGSPPSEVNQQKFIIEFLKIANDNGLRYMMFGAFDENWKANQSESDYCNCGEHWGVFNANREPKLFLKEIDK